MVVNGSFDTSGCFIVGQFKFGNSEYWHPCADHWCFVFCKCYSALDRTRGVCLTTCTHRTVGVFKDLWRKTKFSKSCCMWFLLPWCLRLRLRDLDQLIPGLPLHPREINENKGSAVQVKQLQRGAKIRFGCSFSYTERIRSNLLLLCPHGALL